MNNGLNQNIYIPIANPEIVGGVKLQNKELTNQQFFDSIFTKYVSFTLPYLGEEGIKIHLLMNLYSNPYINDDPIVEIDTRNIEGRNVVFGVNSSGTFSVDEEGFNYLHQGKPVFVNIQEFYTKTVLIAWKFLYQGGETTWNCSLFPTMNIGIATGSGSGGENPPTSPSYKGYFAVTDNSLGEKSSVIISNGVVKLNGNVIKVDKNYFDLLENITGYVVDTLKYKNSIEKNYGGFDDELITGKITKETLDPSYVIGKTETTYPCELRLVVSIYKDEPEIYYTLNGNNNTNKSTDALIATIDKNKDNSLYIIQQQYGELRLTIE